MNWLYRKRASTILFEYLKGLSNNEVFLLPANSCPIVPATFLKAGVSFQILDIDPTSYLIDAHEVEATISNSTNNFGLLFIRTFGFMNNQDPLFTRLKSLHPQLKIIDDRCLAPPCFDAEEFSPNAELTLFSTGYSKIVEHGGGGYAYFRGNPPAPSSGFFDPLHHEALIRRFKKSIDERSQFIYEDTDWLELGKPTLAFDEYRQQTVPKLKTSLAHKEKINQIYSDQLRNNTDLELLGDDYNHWRFNLLTDNKDAILRAIFSSEYFASSHYSSLAGVFDDSKAPVAHNMGRRILNLFNDHRISENMAREICNIVNETSRCSSTTALKS